MKNKLLLLVGTGLGYVLGARAGRDKYDSLVEQAQTLWGDPRVQDAVTNAKSSTGSAFSSAQEQVKGKVSEVKESRGSGTTGTSATDSFSSTTASEAPKGGSTSGFQPTTNTSSFGSN